MPALSQRSQAFQPQPMFEILAAAQDLEAQGHPVLHLEIGDTKGFTNPHIVSRLQELSQNPSLGYIASGGMPEIRGAFARQYTQEKGVTFGADNVVVAPANALISQYLGVTCDPGNAVLLPDPGFPTYFLAARYNGLRIVTYPLDPETGWNPDPAQVERLISEDPGIRAMIVNSPSNPLGTVMDPERLDALLDIAERNGLHCLLDETYKNLVFAGDLEPLPHRSSTTYLYSLSKDAAAPGLRVGCAVSQDTRLIAKLVDYSSLFFSCGPGLMQQVAASYISRPDALAFAREIRTETSSRVALVEKILGDVDGLSYIRPSATFFVFLNISCTGLDSRAFAYELLRERHVCVCPGDSFGQQGEGHVRVTLTGDRQELEEGMRRLADFVRARS